MKRSSVFAASLLVAGVALADSSTIETEYEIGVMPLSTNLTEMIIAIPWVGEGSAGGAAAVTNLIKTAGLDERDTLKWYNPSEGKYYQWVLTTVDDVKYWTPVNTETGSGSSSVLADAAALSQGQAVVLTRASGSNPVYVVGQVGTNSTATTTLTSGVYSLIAPPRITDSDLNSSSVVTGWNETCAGDKIYVAKVVNGTNTLSVYTYEDGAWGETTYSERKWPHGETAVIPAGQGFYYFREANKADLSITWQGVPTAQN